MKTLRLSSALITAAVLSGCTWHSVGKHNAVTLDTGIAPIDAASHVAAGAYLGTKTDAENTDSTDRKNDPKVKALNDAFDRAKARKLTERAASSTTTVDQDPQP